MRANIEFFLISWICIFILFVVVGVTHDEDIEKLNKRIEILEEK